MTRPASLILAAALFALTPLHALAQEIPIRSITLYRSGVGFFERNTRVDGNADLQLRFATDQINDILKSMVLLDLDGGRVASVRYGSKEPLSRRLASFGVDISDNPALAELLNRLRGAPVKLSTSEGAVSGTILGVEKRTVPVGEKSAERPFINLVTSTGMRSLDATLIQSFELQDPTLAAELNKALAALAEHRADRVKTVDVSLAGEGTRRVVVAYVHEMPVWKTSYRLVLPEETDSQGKDAGGRPTIHGWAIVENTTDEDWERVSLSLVAGRPVSFQMDLYEPLHVERPLLPVPNVPGVAPRVYAGAALKMIAPGSPEPSPPSRGRASGQSPFRDNQQEGVYDRAAGDSDASFFGEQGGDAWRYAPDAVAAGVEVGQVFQYRLSMPVSVDRQQSAMLPILTSPIEGRRVSIFNRADGSAYPMRGVQLTNDTSLQLMPGPLSVFDGTSYAGDAQIGHVSVGDKRLLAYAIDLDVAAQTTDEFSGQIERLRIAGGVLIQTTKRQSVVRYAFSNKDVKRARTILVEHAKSDGWTLVEPKAPAEETPAIYRFELPCPPAKGAELRVVQERIDRQTIHLTDVDINWLGEQVRGGKTSQKVADAVREAHRLASLIRETERAVQTLTNERNEITAEQGRIRENMRTIDRNTQLYTRYMTKLNEQETRLEEIKDLLAKADAELTQRRAALSQYLGGLNVE